MIVVKRKIGEIRAWIHYFGLVCWKYEYAEISAFEFALMFWYKHVFCFPIAENWCFCLFFCSFLHFFYTPFFWFCDKMLNEASSMIRGFSIKIKNNNDLLFSRWRNNNMAMQVSHHTKVVVIIRSRIIHISKVVLYPDGILRNSQVFYLFWFCF